MTTITEDYVSFETAKLLKEKGFNERTIYGYIRSGNIVTDCCYCNIPGFPNDYDYNNTKVTGHYVCAKPTIQMAMKWLREVHKLYIEITPSSKTNEFIVDSYRIDIVTRFFDTIYVSSGYNTYEEACEVAIKYCLDEHLI